MNLFEYLRKRMSMSHIYQPVMIYALLRNGGSASKNEIAKAILAYDKSQIEYYALRVNNMVGKVLRQNGVVSREKNQYRLIGFEQYSQEELSDLEKLCQQKIEDYLTSRKDPFEHRNNRRRPVSGSTRYEVLKRAKYRCELCGISAEERAIDVDHIFPKSLGGEDSLINYQALCYLCNTNKGNRDSADFRKLKEHFDLRQPGCLFCDKPDFKPVAENNLAYAIRDAFPVTKGHTLIIPKRHSRDWFSLDQAEHAAINELAMQIQSSLLKEFPEITGFNLGTNAGSSAGQTVFHTHLHLIPRRPQDVDDPRGGVRHCVIGKGYY